MRPRDYQHILSCICDNLCSRHGIVIWYHGNRLSHCFFQPQARNQVWNQSFFGFGLLACPSAVSRGVVMLNKLWAAPLKTCSTVVYCYCKKKRYTVVVKGLSKAKWSDSNARVLRLVLGIRYLLKGMEMTTHVKQFENHLVWKEIHRRVAAVLHWVRQTVWECVGLVETMEVYAWNYWHLLSPEGLHWRSVHWWQCSVKLLGYNTGILPRCRGVCTRTCRGNGWVLWVTCDQGWTSCIALDFMGCANTLWPCYKTQDAVLCWRAWLSFFNMHIV